MLLLGWDVSIWNGLLVNGISVSIRNWALINRIKC